MKLPLDVKALLEEATDIDTAARTPLSVSVYLDSTGPVELLNTVMAAFNTTAPHARVSVATVSDAIRAPYPGDDIAVVVAGLDPEVGKATASLRKCGVPAMVATTLPVLVGEIAQEVGHPIPTGDVVAPGGISASLAERVSGNLRGVAPATVTPDANAEEPLPLDERGKAQLLERMGAWVIATCREKRLAFALAFPFVRKPLSLEAVGSTSIQNAGVGLVVILPGADMPVMTLNQAKMLLQIAAAYGQPMNLARIKELAAVVGGAFACRAAARQLVGMVPGLGWAIKAGIGYAGTEAMGRAAIEYFERGGSADGLAAVVEKAREVAETAQAGASVVTAVKQAAESVAQAAKAAQDAAGGAIARATQLPEEAPIAVEPVSASPATSAERA